MSMFRALMMSRGGEAAPLLHIPLDTDWRCLLNGEPLTDDDVTVTGDAGIGEAGGVACAVTGDWSSKYFELTSDRAKEALGTVSGSAPRTVSIWYCRLSGNNSWDWHGLVGWGSKNSNRFYSIEFKPDYDNLLTNLWSYSGDIIEESFETIEVPENEWHHAVSVFVPETTEVLTYLDGALVGRAVPRTFDTANSAKIAVGTRFEDDSHYFAGGLRDARIYAQAMSAAEVAALYNQQKSLYQ